MARPEYRVSHPSTRGPAKESERWLVEINQGVSLPFLPPPPTSNDVLAVGEARCVDTLPSTRLFSSLPSDFDEPQQG